MGDILNEYLSQSLKSDGTIKDNSVTANTLAPNSVTNSALASNSVNATIIADGSITEALLDTSLQTKVNTASSPDWTAITNKPSVATLNGTETLTNKTLVSPSVSTPTGIVKGDVGLGNVDNTSDVGKPVSTATQAALNNKVDIISSSARVYSINSGGAQSSIPYTSTGSGSTVMTRDVSGRSQVVDPSVSADIANKNYVDTASTVVHTAGNETVAGVKTFSSAMNLGSNLTVGDGTGSNYITLNGTAYNGVDTKIYSDVASAYSFFRRYRGTVNSPTQVMSGDYIGSFGFRAANETGASNSQDAVRISAVAEENITTTSQKSSLSIFTAPNNSITPRERMRISGDGSVTIGYGANNGHLLSVGRRSNLSPDGVVATSGTTTLTGTGTVFTELFRVGDTITVSGETARTITAIASDTSLTVSAAFSTTASNLTYVVQNNAHLFKVRNNGNIGINIANPASRLNFGAGTTEEDGILFGTDTNLYRSAANTLRTDDTLVIGTAGTAAGSAVTIDGTQTLTNKNLVSSTNTYGAEPLSAAGGMIYVNHGATNTTVRPSVSGMVAWIGSVEPLNAIDGDIWIEAT